MKYTGAPCPRRCIKLVESVLATTEDMSVPTGPVPVGSGTGSVTSSDDETPDVPGGSTAGSASTAGLSPSVPKLGLSSTGEVADLDMCGKTAEVAVIMLGAE